MILMRTNTSIKLYNNGYEKSIVLKNYFLNLDLKTFKITLICVIIALYCIINLFLYINSGGKKAQ